MKKQLLPVPVLADSAQGVLAESHGSLSGEARESTKDTRSGLCTADSRGGQKLFVVRQSSSDDRSRYFFYAVRGPEIVERVTARSASLIWDYLEANWPHGTRVYWIIL